MADKAEKKDAVEAEVKTPAKKAASAKKASGSGKKSSDAAKPAAEKKASAKKAEPKAAPAVRPGVLKVHHLRPVPGSNTAKTRVGRGEGSKGKTAGRGTKGQKARYQVKVGFEGGQ